MTEVNTTLVFNNPSNKEEGWIKVTWKRRKPDPFKMSEATFHQKRAQESATLKSVISNLAPITDPGKEAPSCKPPPKKGQVEEVETETLTPALKVNPLAESNPSSLKRVRRKKKKIIRRTLNNHKRNEHLIYPQSDAEIVERAVQKTLYRF